MYDLIILGGGPAGYNAAERAGKAGMKTLIIEKENLGGVCLNKGCIPSKSLLHCAKIFRYVKNNQFGIYCDNPRFDLAEIIEHKKNVVSHLVKGVKIKLKDSGVEILNEEACIAGKEKEGYCIKTGNNVHIGRNLLIATGSKAIEPKIEGYDEAVKSNRVITEQEIFDLTEIPSKIIIIGGGVIGLEMAVILNSFGSHVTIIELLDHIAGNIDRDIGETLKKNCKEKGIQFILNAKVTSIHEGTVKYILNNKQEELTGDKVLFSIGRKADTTGIGIESIGLSVDKGNIVTDEYLKTSQPNVYAAGDVNGKIMLAHKAIREAEVAVNNMLGQNDRIFYSEIPGVIYTDPEVAFIGETLESCRIKGIKAEETRLSMQYSGRYVAENKNRDGFIKLITSENKKKILGIHMIGNSSSEIISLAALAIHLEVNIELFKKMVFPHPSVSEIIKETLFYV